MNPRAGDWLAWARLAVVVTALVLRFTDLISPIAFDWIMGLWLLAAVLLMFRPAGRAPTA